MSDGTGNTADIVKRIEESHKRLEAELGTSQQLFQQLKTTIIAAVGGSEDGSGVDLELEEPGSDDVDHQSPEGDDDTTPPSSPSSSLSTDASSREEQVAPVEGAGSGSSGVSSSPEMIAGTSAAAFRNSPGRRPRPAPAHGLADPGFLGKGIHRRRWYCLCGKCFNNGRELKRHCVIATKGTRDCVCPVADCSAAFFEWRDVTRHLKRTHQLNRYYCKWCENHFDSTAERDLHMRTDPECSVAWKQERRQGYYAPN